MRSYFFGKEASTTWNIEKIQSNYNNYIHKEIDIREYSEIEKVFKQHGKDIKVIIHAAAQPSHDWAAKEPFTDFTINANGTLNMLEATRLFAPDAVFIFTSTNKVYGDTPNYLPLEEGELRWNVNSKHKYAIKGIDESMSIDNSKHSLFGASKVSADILVQEYGKYFGLKCAVFRGGCLTGPAHSGAELHGFLAYLILCAVGKKEYSIFGYKGKQVRDNIHSKDLINAFWEFQKSPKMGEVYNIGGGIHSNVSMLEAIKKIKDFSGHKLKYSVLEENRIGDHTWYISDVSKFQNHYPNWKYEYNIDSILKEMILNAEEKVLK